MKQNPTAIARRQEAWRDRDRVIAALDQGKTFVMGARTNVEAGTVHAVLGKRLVLLGTAEYLPDPERDGCKLETHIRLRKGGVT